MKFVFYFTIILVLTSCTFLYDSVFETNTIYSEILKGKVIDTSEDILTTDITKDYLIELTKINGDKYKTILEISYRKISVSDTKDPDYDSVLVYLQPIYDDKKIIYAEYPQGMPIMLYKNVVDDDHRSYVVERNSIFGKFIIMTNGYVEFADSCYNDYVILPVVPDSIGANFEIEKCSFELNYKDANGNLRKVKEIFYDKN
jgi:hypothetical protein